MPSLTNLKTRLNSVSSTQKIIKAMELVASSKIKKAREKVEAVKFFEKTTIKSMNGVARTGQYGDLVKQNVEGYDMFLVITSDMGLCGSYNTNVLKRYFKELKTTDNFKTIVIGTKGINKIEYEKMDIFKKITNADNVDTIQLSKEITETVIEDLENNKLRSLRIIYTEMISPIQQEVRVIDLLDSENWKDNSRGEIIEVEPSEEEVFDKLFKQYVLTLVYTSLLNSFASEHSFRRNSMDAANTNSLELIDKLSLELNRARQTMITQEITEIIGGSESSKKE